MRVAYFVHDLTDPAVRKRVRMLQAAGLDVIVAGFRRETAAPAALEGAPVIDLGRTHDGQFVQRAVMVLARRLELGRWAHELRGADVLLARNLEMLTLAAAARSAHAPAAGLAYECLDVHRLMISPAPWGAALRGLESRLLRQAGLLIVSSPAFLSAYFEPRHGVGRALPLSTLLVENKPLDLDGGARPAVPPPPGPPWRIGWFGMLRCQRSLDILCDLADRRPDLVEVVIRGRPARTAFSDFEDQVRRARGVAFKGPYQAADLEQHYREVHFNWAVDYFEEGANSNWLLPNRIYEGGRYGAVPIALSHVETGRWLGERQLGALMDDPAEELEPWLDQLTVARYAELQQACAAAPMEGFVANRSECLRLASALAETRLRSPDSARP